MRVDAQEIGQRASTLGGHTLMIAVPQRCAPTADGGLRDPERRRDFLLGKAPLTQGSFEVDAHGRAL